MAPAIGTVVVIGGIVVAGVAYLMYKNSDNKKTKNKFSDSLSTKEDWYKSDKIIIIHGTDTVDLTSKFIEDKIEGKKIVFTGAMVPMSIDEVEATMNFSQAIGFLNAPIKNGIYLSMHGSVIEHSKLKKDRSVGQFLVKN